jgi:alcohol dehydrogenase
VLAERAVELLMRELPRAVADPAADAPARSAVALASTVAGMAFGNADVAAVHCLSEAIGGLLDLPHGLLNAVLLVPVLRSQGEAVEASLAGLARAAGIGEAGSHGAAEAFLDRVEALAGGLAIPSFSALGIDPAHHPAIAREAAANGSNPSCARTMDEAAYRELLASLG